MIHFPFKHFIVALLIPSLASAADLCSRVLISRPSAQHAEATLQDLSNLKYQLDVAQVRKSNDEGINILKDEFKLKLLEIQNRLGMDDASLRTEISKRISILQKRAKDDKKIELRERKALEKILARTWQMKNRVELEENGNVVWLDAELNKAIVEWSHDGYLVNLKTGKAKPLNVLIGSALSSITRLANSDEVLVQSPAANSQGRRAEFKVINLRTGKKTSWGEDGLAKVETSGSWQLKRNPDNRTLLAANLTEFFVLDAVTGKIIKSGKLPKNNFGPFTLLNQDQIIFSSFPPNSKLNIFSLSTGELKTLSTAGDNVKVLDNGDFLFRAGETLFRYDLATEKLIERKFDRSFNLQGIEGDKVWISTSTFFSGKSELRLVNLKDLQDAKDGPFREFNDEGLQITHLNKDYLTVHSANKNSEVWGVYNKKTLDAIEWFTDFDDYQIVTNIFVSGTKDGKTIIVYGEDSEHVKTLEIWGRN